MNQKIIPLFLWMLLVSFFFSCGSGNSEKNYSEKDSLHAHITLSGAFALYPMVVKWTEEYQKICPGVTFDIQAGGAGKGLADALSGMVDAGMVSRSISPEEIAKGAWPLAVAKDAVLPTINNNNPYLNKIQTSGITRDQFKKIWIDGTIKTWGELLGNGSREKILVFTRSDAGGAAETWASFFGKRQEDLQGIGVFGDPGVAESVIENKFSVGFNNANYVYDMKTKLPFAGIGVIPLDLDSNGILDEKEKFYSNIDDLNRGIVEGTYPSPPARDLLLVFKGKPEGAAMKKFLMWILSDGQKFVSSAGYVQLGDEKLQRELEKIR